MISKWSVVNVAVEEVNGLATLMRVCDTLIGAMPFFAFPMEIVPAHKVSVLRQGFLFLAGDEKHDVPTTPWREHSTCQRLITGVTPESSQFRARIQVAEFKNSRIERHSEMR